MRHLFAALALSCAALAQAASPTHVYLMDDASDLLGGPALTTLGGDFTAVAGRYSFGANQGFWLENAIGSTVYTLDFVFRFEALQGYRRLVDFKNLGSDTGAYALNGGLNFYPVVTGPAVFSEGQDARVTLSRDAAGLLTGYVDGVQQFQFIDAGGLGEFSAANQIAYFFVDDNAIGGEASAGSVDYLAIYADALSATEIATLPSPVPEPASAALALAGLAVLIARQRRRH